MNAYVYLYRKPIKKYYLNQATQKNTCQMFLPKKILQSSWSPEIRSTPWDNTNNKKTIIGNYANP